MLCPDLQTFWMCRFKLSPQKRCSSDCSRAFFNLVHPHVQWFGSDPYLSWFNHLKPTEKNLLYGHCKNPIAVGNGYGHPLRKSRSAHVYHRFLVFYFMFCILWKISQIPIKWSQLSFCIIAGQLTEGSFVPMICSPGWNTSDSQILPGDWFPTKKIAGTKIPMYNFVGLSIIP